MKTANEKAKNNTKIFMERGPGLYRDMSLWVVARDRKQKMVLLGGLGACGVGEMWFEDNGDYAQDPEYEAAPELDCGFGTREP
jgi:hypothetical protein